MIMFRLLAVLYLITATSCNLIVEREEHLYLWGCLKTVIENYLIETTYSKPLEVVLNDNRIVEDYLVRKLFEEVRWSYFVGKIRRDTPASFSDANYVVVVKKGGDLDEVLRLLKLKNIYWNNSVKMLIVVLEKRVEDIIKMLQNEDINGFIVAAVGDNNYNCYVSKNLQCNFRSCVWNDIMKNVNYCHNGKLVHNNGTKIYHNRPKNEYTVLLGNEWPYIMNTSNGTTSRIQSTPQGIEQKLINLVGDLMNVTFRYFQHDPSMSTGEVLPNGTATGLLGLLQDKTADVAIHGYSLTFERATTFHATPSYTFNQFGWFVPHEPTKNFHIAVDPYVVLSILVVFVTIVVLCASLGAMGWGDAFLNGYAAVIGTTVVLPRGHELRLLFGLLLVLNLFLNIIFYTFLISALANQTNDERYGTEQKMIDSNLQLKIYATKTRYLKGYSYYSRLVGCSDIPECFKSVATLKDSAYATSYIEKNLFLDEYKVNNKAAMYALPPILSHPIVFYMRRGFPYYKKVREVIYWITESGTMEKFIKDITPPDVPPGEGNKFLTIGDFKPIFVLFVILYSMCFLIFITELLFKKILKIN